MMKPGRRGGDKEKHDGNERESERGVSEKASEGRRYKRWRKRETEMEPSSRPFTAIITL